MKRISFLSLFLSLTLFVFAQQPDAEYKLIRHSYTINADGSMDYRFHKELVLHANRAMTAYATNGETFILYDPLNEVLTINDCYFVRPDGSIVETPANAFIQQLPSQCENCATYNGIREMVIVHTGLELEGTIVLDYTIHSHRFLNEHLYLVDDYPIKRYELTVNADPSHRYFIQPENLDRIQYNTYGDKGSFQLIAYNLPKRYVGQYLPNDNDLYPHVYLSNITLQDMERMLPKHSSISGNEEIKQFAQQFIKDDLAQTIKDIRNYVNDNLTIAKLNTSLILPNRLDADQVYRTNCADMLSQVSYLESLLSYAGINSEIDWGYVPLQVYEDQHYVIVDPQRTRIHTTIDGLPYSINPYNSSVDVRLENTAKDAVKSIDITETLDFNPDTITSHYAMFTIPVDPRGFNVKFQYITPYRDAPVKCRPINENYHYTVQLPAGVKLLNSVKKSFGKEGLGKVEVSITQKGQTLDIQRRLVIAKDIITISDMVTFYQIMNIWDYTSRLTFEL